MCAALVIALMLMALMPVSPSMGAPPVYSISVIAPNGGEELVQGQLTRISWTVSSSGGYIRLMYTTDSNDKVPKYTSIDTVSNVMLGPRIYEWRVPWDVESTACRVRVVWTDGLGPSAKENANDSSDADFSIARGTFMRFINMSAEYTYGKYYPVRWEIYDPDDEVASLDLEVRVDTGSGWGAWYSQGARYEGMEPYYSYVFWSPPYYNSSRGMLRLISRDAAGAALGEVYSPEFDIRSAMVMLVYPNGGEALVQGETVTIEWRVVQDPGELITGAALYYSTTDGASWSVITLSTEADNHEDWTVPSGGTSDRVRVRVDLYYLEFSVLASDASDGPNRIIADRSTLSITLTDPNPPVTGNFIQGGTEYYIRWTITGSESEITGFEGFYSVNSGAGWVRVDQVASTARIMRWTVPMLDIDTARVRISITTATGRISSISNRDFIIYTNASFNLPPKAEAGVDQRVNEFERVTLNGWASYDPNRDPLTYSWTVVNDGGFNVTLTDADTAAPWFVPNIDDYEYTMIFQLEVGDGQPLDPTWFFYTDSVSVTVVPAPPSIIDFTPKLGWAGTSITVTGQNCAGSTLYIGDVAAATFPTLYVDGTAFTFTLHPGIPVGANPLVLRNLAGESTTPDTLEVHPAPEWIWENGLPWHNQADHFLSYPWDVTAARGNYRTTFGDVIYIPVWICIGIPWYDPWNGLVCLGYEVDVPSGIPDPLAALYYGCFYCWIGRMGQCFGLSATALQFYHGDLNVRDFNDSTIRVNQLDHRVDGTIDHWQESMQGSQLSLEVLDHYLYEFMHGLEPSNYGIVSTGMGRFLRQVEDAVDSGDLGVITIIAGGSGHAVVPYHVEEVDNRTTRIYVYDCNREYFSFENETDIPTRYDEFNNFPPYIEIEKSRPYWRWRYQWPDGSMWSDTVGIVFCPYDLVNGPRTLPTDWDGLVSFLAGDVSSSVEDDGGNVMRWAANGTVEAGIEGMAPLPNFGALGDDPHGWYSATWGNLTTTVMGRKDGGLYNWTLFANGTAAYGLELAGTSDGAYDTLDLTFKSGIALQGQFTYGTTEASKRYGFVHVKKMGDPSSEEGRIRQRVYRVLDATLHGDSTALINTTDDYQSLVFENRGPHAITIGVEFQTNVMGEDAWNATGREVPDHLPTARLLDIEVAAYERLTIRPSNWLDLDNAEVIVQREVPDALPPGQVATFMADSRLGQVRFTWTPPGDDGGAPVTDYVIWRGPRYNEMNQFATVPGSDRSYMDDSVVVGETYFYGIQAVNRIGPGKMSPSVGVWVQQGPARPSAPVDLVATVAAGTVILSWSLPEDDGGGTISGYQIFREEVEWASGPTLLTEVGAVTKYTDGTVEANTTYYYWIAAVNEAGEGMILGPVSATVPPSGGGDGDGDDDAGDGGGYPMWEYALAAVIVVGAVSAGVFIGLRGKGVRPRGKKGT